MVDTPSSRQVSLFSTPIYTLKVLSILLARFIKQTMFFISHHLVLILSLLLALAAFLYAPGPHEEVHYSAHLFIVQGDD